MKLSRILNKSEEGVANATPSLNGSETETVTHTYSSEFYRLIDCFSWQMFYFRFYLSSANCFCLKFYCFSAFENHFLSARLVCVQMLYFIQGIFFSRAYKIIRR